MTVFQWRVLLITLIHESDAGGSDSGDVDDSGVGTVILIVVIQMKAMLQQRRKVI
jgi:hypothetical protein